MNWLYLNSIAILIGFELNVSIIAARTEDVGGIPLTKTIKI